MYNKKKNENKNKKKQKNKHATKVNDQQLYVAMYLHNWNARVDKGTQLLRWFGESNLVSIVLTEATRTSSIYLLNRQARRTLKNEET